VCRLNHLDRSSGGPSTVFAGCSQGRLSPFPLKVSMNKHGSASAGAEGSGKLRNLLLRAELATICDLLGGPRNALL
jgi:hypothetical protein